MLVLQYTCGWSIVMLCHMTCQVHFIWSSTEFISHGLKEIAIVSFVKSNMGAEDKTVRG